MTGHRKIYPLATLIAFMLAAPAFAMSHMGMMSPQPTVKHGVFVDKHGMTLYTFNKDTDGTSHCYGKCAVLWPPLLAPSSATAMGKFTIVARKDGTKQWAYHGKPLYLFQKDTKPGDERGNGFKGLWELAEPG